MFYIKLVFLIVKLFWVNLLYRNIYYHYYYYKREWAHFLLIITIITAQTKALHFFKNQLLFYWGYFFVEGGLFMKRLVHDILTVWYCVSLILSAFVCSCTLKSFIIESLTRPFLLVLFRRSWRGLART